MNRSIIPSDDPILRVHAKDIATSEIASPFIQTLISDMQELLAAERLGVAIAAPQVGEALRLFVVSGRALLTEAEAEALEKTESPAPKDLVFINPRLLKTSRRRKDMHEGCLSLPGFWGMVPRSERATVSAYDETGKEFTRGASGLLAHIFQHEMDHLEGILYTDKAHDLYQEKSDDPSEKSLPQVTA